jgi:hypothetical protein
LVDFFPSPAAEEFAPHLEPLLRTGCHQRFFVLQILQTSCGQVVSAHFDFQYVSFMSALKDRIPVGGLAKLPALRPMIVKVL